ncbi:hypothetical protein ANN_24703 [Periplaneta americana]|uniref:Uncharacterized protein n=1 Tax=Periplaneta americana TaxID=6978 RepID=A0ABQ8RZE5_PERAM|nr:hypothetical protein ANN_24703 [Periplaneta americana]
MVIFVNKEIAMAENVRTKAYNEVREAKLDCYLCDITLTEISAEVKLQSLLDHAARRIYEKEKGRNSELVSK